MVDAAGDLGKLVRKRCIASMRLFAMGDPRQFQLVFCLWTRNIVRTVLKKEKGVELSKSAVCRLLQYMGLTPQRPIHRS